MQIINGVKFSKILMIIKQNYSKELINVIKSYPYYYVFKLLQSSKQK